MNFILDSETKDRLIDELFKQITNESDFSKELYMSIEDIKKLDKQGYLGTHSDLHWLLWVKKGYQRFFT